MTAMANKQEWIIFSSRWNLRARGAGYAHGAAAYLEREQDGDGLLVGVVVIQCSI
jgi:hypothetical protein